MVVAFALWAVVVTDVASPGGIVGILCISGFAAGVNVTSSGSRSCHSSRAGGDAERHPPQLDAVHRRVPSDPPWLGSCWRSSVRRRRSWPSLSFLVVIAALLTIHPRPIEMPTEFPRVMDHFRAGVAYVRRSKALVLSVLTITVLSFFGSSVIQFAAPLASDVFDVGKAEYGLLVGASAPAPSSGHS